MDYTPPDLPCQRIRDGWQRSELGGATNRPPSSRGQAPSGVWIPAFAVMTDGKLANHLNWNAIATVSGGDSAR